VPVLNRVSRAAASIVIVIGIVAATVVSASALGTSGLASSAPWPVGVAIDQRETVGSPASVVASEFSQITAENAMKPDAIQPREGEFTFTGADRLIDFARANGLRVWGHTLVWHKQTPAWFFTDPITKQPLTDSPADRALLLERMRVHITTVATHLSTKYGAFGSSTNPIVAFDVVNEVIDEWETNGLRRSEWYRILGPSFIDSAFQIANDAFNAGKTVDPPVALFLNDYGTEWPKKRQALMTVASGLLDRDIPLGGVGSQFHLTVGSSPVSDVGDTLDAFATLGVEQAVTELDASVSGAVTPESLSTQGEYFRALGERLMRHPELFSVTVWGLNDSRSWRTGAPLLFNDDLSKKPSYDGLRAAVSPKVTPTPTPTPTRTTATPTPTPTRTGPITPTPTPTATSAVPTQPVPAATVPSSTKVPDAPTGVSLKPLQISRVTVSGKLRVGKRLVARVPSALPANARVTYQWYTVKSTGKKVAIATARSRMFTVPKRLKKSTIVVRVTASASGYERAAKWSRLLPIR